MATGSGLGPQTGVFMAPLLMNLGKLHFGLANLLINNELSALFPTGAGILGQGGVGPGGAGSECHKCLTDN